MSDLISNGVDCKNLQSLFTEYNQLYFGGRLPQYKVLLTKDHSHIERRKRKIYINLDKEDASVPLLHEMVHAAAGLGHGRRWLNELRRLADLGAPLQEELERCAPENQISLKQLLAEFFDAGLSAPPDVTWAEVCKRMGYEWGFTDKHGRAKN